ncbi:MAG: DNA-3-methyladenine glycosylase [Cytophagaceae bacterium]
MKVNKDFYLQNDVLEISRSLLGKFLFTNINGCLTGGMIVETEAYKAPEDKASHAYGNRRTARTETFYQEGGISYVYMCYGIHHLFNIITNFENIPHAVLVRGIEPVEGMDIMLERRKKDRISHELTAGPGSLSQALGITREHNGLSLRENVIWIEDRNIQIEQEQILAGPRVGIAYAEEFALMPWRFSIKGNKFVSRAK